MNFIKSFIDTPEQSLPNTPTLPSQRKIIKTEI